MKIFLEERSIGFFENRPVGLTQDVLTIEYQSKKQIMEAWEEFESVNDGRSLLIWSEKGKEEALSEFYSLFKVIIAAGGVVRNEKNEILFIFRYGKWDLPKGKLDTHHSPQVTFEELNGFKINENPVEAAIREVKEETGLKEVKVLHELSSTYHIFYKNKKRLLKRTYWFEMFAGSDQALIPQEKEGITVVRWVGKQEKSEILKNTYASLRDLISNALQEPGVTS